MTGIWVRLIKRHRIWKQETRTCAYSDARDELTEVCRALDVPCPIWMSKHEREFEEFRRTAFNKDHFMESIEFDKLEIEFIDGDTKKKSQDPRNA